VNVDPVLSDLRQLPHHGVHRRRVDIHAAHDDHIVRPPHDSTSENKSLLFPALAARGHPFDNAIEGTPFVQAL
jgi:hypothetical protein